MLSHKAIMQIEYCHSFSVETDFQLQYNNVSQTNNKADYTQCMSCSKGHTPSFQCA